MVSWVYTIPSTTLFCVVENVIQDPLTFALVAQLLMSVGYKGRETKSDCSLFQNKEPSAECSR